MKHSKWLLFSDDIKILTAVSSVDDCILLQSDMERIQGRPIANFMKLNSSKTWAVSFTKEKMFFIILTSYGTIL